MALKQINYEQLAKVTQLKPLEMELTKLEDLSASIVRDFEYMKKREKEMELNHLKDNERTFKSPNKNELNKTKQEQIKTKTISSKRPKVLRPMNSQTSLRANNKQSILNKTRRKYASKEQTCQGHSFLSDVTDVRQMEQGLLQLLDDFIQDVYRLLAKI